MQYSIIGILAAIVLLIINNDVLFGGAKSDALANEHSRVAYRNFLFGVMAYYIADALWGILDSFHLVSALFLDTQVYFAAMAASVFLWTRYVIAYLGEEGSFARVLKYVGTIFLAFELVMLAINFFLPILFWFEPNGTYHAGLGRYLTLGFQMPMYFVFSAYTLWLTTRGKDSTSRRHLTVGLFGLSMIMAVALQMALPLWPIYSMGYLLGTCTLHAFVVEDKKDEYRRALEEMIEREQKQELELGSAKKLAYTDSLTGVKSPHAYVETKERLDQRIAQSAIGEFSVAVFDLNDLKLVNDMYGHDEGDRYIIDACRLVCNGFKHSPVFRIGGDEFVAILEGSDFAHRVDLLKDFDRQIDENLKAGKVVVASGMADFDPLNDRDFEDVFERADAKMYLRKESLKGMS